MKLPREETAGALTALATLLDAGHAIWTGKRMPLNPEGTNFDMEAGRAQR